MGDTTADRSEPSRAPRIILGVALIASAALMLHYRLQVGFIFDDLVFLKDRSFGGLESLLEPHNGNIVLLQAALYRLSYILFGVGSPVPLQVITLPVFLLSVVAFFCWIRLRVGEWIAAILSIPLLFLGTGYQDLIWSFQIGYTASLSAGILALICLENDGRYNRIIACLALCVAVTSSSLGAPFLAAAAVLITLRNGWRSLFGYAFLIPVAIMVAWYLGWGRHAESFISLANLLDSPWYVVESVKSVLMGLIGFHRLSSPVGDILGWISTALVVAVVAVRLIKQKSLPRAFLVALALGLAFWILASANQIPGMVSRDPDQSRYQFPGAIFLLMIVAGAFSGARPGRNLLLTLAVLAGISVTLSLGAFASGSKILIGMATPPKAAMTAIDIAGDQVVPSYKVRLVQFFPFFIDQTELARIEDRYGKTGWSNDQISDLTGEARAELDSALVSALGLKVKPSGTIGSGECRTQDLDPEGVEIADLRSGRISFRPSFDLMIGVNRFSADSLRELGQVPAGNTGALAIDADRSPQPWRVVASGEGQLRFCVEGRNSD